MQRLAPVWVFWSLKSSTFCPEQGYIAFFLIGILVTSYNLTDWPPRELDQHLNSCFGINPIHCLDFCIRNQGNNFYSFWLNTHTYAVQADKGNKYSQREEKCLLFFHWAYKQNGLCCLSKIFPRQSTGCHGNDTTQA